MGQPYIELIDIHKSFSGNHVLDGVNLTIEKGMVTCIIGKSGTGKICFDQTHYRFDAG